MVDKEWDELPKYKPAEIGIPQRPFYERLPLIHLIYISFAIISNIATFEIASNTSTRGLTTRIDQAFSQSLTKESFYAEIDQSRHIQMLSPFTFEGSKYTAPASAEVDAEWAALGVSYDIFLIPEELKEAFNISSDNVLIPADTPGNHWGSGYAANMNGPHHLHCLNLLRKALFYNYEYYASQASNYSGLNIEPGKLHNQPFAEFTDAPLGIRAHVNHCVDSLREHIMCEADSGVSLYRWRDNAGGTTPDFARPKQCRNYESVRQFAERRQMLFEDNGKSLKTPLDVKLYEPQ